MLPPPPPVTLWQQERSAADVLLRGAGHQQCCVLPHAPFFLSSLRLFEVVYTCRRSIHQCKYSTNIRYSTDSAVVIGRTRDRRPLTVPPSPRAQTSR